jgi:hypothetical protein
MKNRPLAHLRTDALLAVLIDVHALAERSGALTCVDRTAFETGYGRQRLEEAADAILNRMNAIKSS